MLINIFTWFLFYSLSLIVASMKFTFSLFTFSPSALHYISNSHSHSHFYISSYLLLLLFLLSSNNPFTFLPFYFFTFKRPFTFKTASRRSACYVATCLALRRDVAIATSGRSFGGIGRGCKRHRNTVRNPEKCTFKFVTFLLIGFGIVKFLPVCASTA